jgi:hypothetical protein
MTTFTIFSFLIICLLLGLAPSGPLHNYDCLVPAITLSSALSKIVTIFLAERLTTPENPPRKILKTVNFNSADCELRVFSDSVQYTSSSRNVHIRASSSPGDKKQVLRGSKLAPPDWFENDWFKR